METYANLPVTYTTHVCNFYRELSVTIRSSFYPFSWPGGAVHKKKLHSGRGAFFMFWNLRICKDYFRYFCRGQNCYNFYKINIFFFKFWNILCISFTTSFVFLKQSASGLARFKSNWRKKKWGFLHFTKLARTSSQELHEIRRRNKEECN